MAQVLVQNRVSLALPVIPALVQNEGINVRKMSPNTLMIVNLISPSGKYDDLAEQLCHGCEGRTGPTPRRRRHNVPRERDYSLRVWLDANKMAGLEPERHGRGHGHHPAERPGRRRTNRPAACPQGPAVPVDHQHAGAAHRPRAVRQHHPQGRSKQPAGAGSTASTSGQQAQGSSGSGRPALPVTGIVRLRDVAASSRGRNNTTSPAPWTASLRWRSPSTSFPAPTRWKRPAACRRR